jgi:hypothetical protein
MSAGEKPSRVARQQHPYFQRTSVASLDVVPAAAGCHLDSSPRGLPVSPPDQLPALGGRYPSSALYQQRRRQKELAAHSGAKPVSAGSRWDLSPSAIPVLPAASVVLVPAPPEEYAAPYWSAVGIRSEHQAGARASWPKLLLELQMGLGEPEAPRARPPAAQPSRDSEEGLSALLPSFPARLFWPEPPPLCSRRQPSSVR